MFKLKLSQWWRLWFRCPTNDNNQSAKSKLTASEVKTAKIYLNYLSTISILKVKVYVCVCFFFSFFLLLSNRQQRHFVIFQKIEKKSFLLAPQFLLLKLLLLYSIVLFSFSFFLLLFFSFSEI